MPPLFSVSDMRTSEADTIAAGVFGATLVERAGTAVARVIQQHYPHCRRVLVCAGPGNNGADGIVAACALKHAGMDVRVYCWRRTSDMWSAMAHDAHIELDVMPLADTLTAVLSDYDIIIDALLGIGANRAVTTELATIVTAINARPTTTQCIAVDVPSGCMGDGEIAPLLMIRADMTVATGPRKLATCFMPVLAACGVHVSVDIGLLSHGGVCHEATIHEVASWLPARPLDAYKGTFGTLCVWAGSAAYPGAAVLASSAALRAGTGIVSIATTQALVPLLWRMPELTLTLLDEQPLDALSNPRFGAFVVGPGVGRHPDTEALLINFLRLHHLGQRPLVIDADALTLLSHTPNWHVLIPSQQAVLTPHRGELIRLIGGEIPRMPPCALALMLAQRWNQVLVMKGSTTVIADPTGTCMVWPHPNPVLATGGSGDVLAGIIGALLAQGVTCFRAAVLGVVLQGLAARQLRERHGDTGVLPSDIIAQLPAAIAHLRTVAQCEEPHAHL